MTQQERMQLLQILPQQGTLDLVRKVRMLRDSVNLHPSERPQQPPQTAPGIPAVNPRSHEIPPKKFSFTKSTKDLIVEQFKKLDKMAQLPVDFLDLHDKFVEEKT